MDEAIVTSTTDETRSNIYAPVLPASVSRMPVSGTGIYFGVMVDVGAEPVLPAAPRDYLDLKNESMTETVTISFGAASGGPTSGCFTLPPGANKTWEANFVPADEIFAKATGPAPLTIGAY